MILITGGSGVLGSALTRLLAQRGCRVRVLVLPGDRGISRVADCAADVWRGDVTRLDTIKGICEDVTTVYHLAAVILSNDKTLFEKVNVEGTRNMIMEARHAGVDHFVYVSSASVVYPKPTAYSLSKFRAERSVRESALRWTIVRPTLVYQKGKGGEEYDRFLDYLQMFPVVPLIGAGQARKRPVFADDLVEGLAAICGSEVSIGKIYNLSGGESITMLEFARLNLRLMGQAKKPIIKIPVALCTIAARMMEALMSRPPLQWQMIAGVTQDADLDPAEAINDLGYCPSLVSEKLPECFPRQR